MRACLFACRKWARWKLKERGAFVSRAVCERVPARDAGLLALITHKAGGRAHDERELAKRDEKTELKLEIFRLERVCAHHLSVVDDDDDE